MKNKVCAFVIASEDNLKYLEKLKNSLRKFHSVAELPLIEVTGQLLEETLKKDPMFYYRATPVIGAQLIREYEVVLKLDADQIICAPINEAWEGDFDIKVVLNSNPREFKKYPVTLWDIHPIQEYVNCGFVSMKSEKFIDHWHRLCYTKHFDNYQMKEQDLLNILIHYGDYKAELLDNGEGFWGLSTKGFWPQIELKEDKLILPKNDEWNKIDKTIRVLHWAGGNTPNKMNVNTAFQPEVAKYLNKLTAGNIAEKSRVGESVLASINEKG